MIVAPSAHTRGIAIKFVGFVSHLWNWVGSQLCFLEDMAGQSVRRLVSEAEETEIVGIESNPDLGPVSFFMVGKVLTTKPIHKEALFNKLKELWHTVGAFSLSDVGESDRFLVRFEMEEDRLKVLSGCPWSFDNPLVALKATDGRMDPREEEFDSQEIWI